MVSKTPYNLRNLRFRQLKRLPLNTAPCRSDLILRRNREQGPPHRISDLILAERTIPYRNFIDGAAFERIPRLILHTANPLKYLCGRISEMPRLLTPLQSSRAVAHPQPIDGMSLLRSLSLKGRVV